MCASAAETAARAREGERSGVAVALAGAFTWITTLLWILVLIGLPGRRGGALFNWHPILMSLATTILLPAGVLSWQRRRRRPRGRGEGGGDGGMVEEGVGGEGGRGGDGDGGVVGWSGVWSSVKIVHVAFVVAAFVVLNVGIGIAYASHVQQGFPNWYSLHSWMGIAAIIALKTNLLSGLAANTSVWWRNRHRRQHSTTDGRDVDVDDVGGASPSRRRRAGGDGCGGVCDGKGGKGRGGDTDYGENGGYLHLTMESHRRVGMAAVVLTMTAAVLGCAEMQTFLVREKGAFATASIASGVVGALTAAFGALVFWEVKSGSGVGGGISCDREGKGIGKVAEGEFSGLEGVVNVEVETREISSGSGTSS